jgi:hypothetical protein
MFLNNVTSAIYLGNDRNQSFVHDSTTVHIRTIGMMNDNNYHHSNSLAYFTYFFSAILLFSIGTLVNLLVIITYKFGYKNLMINKSLFNISHHQHDHNHSINIPVKRHSQQKEAEKVEETISIKKQKFGRTKKRRLTIAEVSNIKIVSTDGNLNGQKNFSTKNNLNNIENNNETEKNALLGQTKKTSHFSLSNYGKFSLGLARKSRRTLSSFFILSLGCCDFFICLFGIAFVLLLQLGYFELLNENADDFWCKFSHFFIQVPITLEIQILLSIAIDRYLSVFRPIKLYYIDGKKLRQILFLQIFVSVLLCAPNILFYRAKNKGFGRLSNENSPYMTINTLDDYCYIHEAHDQTFHYYQVVLFVLFLVNIVIISTCYLKVYNHVYRASLHQKNESVSRNNSTSRSLNIFTSSNNSKYKNKMSTNSLVKEFVAQKMKNESQTEVVPEEIKSKN